MAEHRLTGTSLTAIISDHGAELQSLKMADGTELIWQADPTFWGRHAPHLFPIVGRLPADQLSHQGKSYAMSQHGFARDSVFELEHATPSECTFLLRENQQTLEKYPFHFEFRVVFTLHDNTLSISYRIKNTGSETLPCSIGAHPAFVWPLPGNDSRKEHSITFSKKESCDVHRLHGGLVLQDTFPWPWQDTQNALPLDDALFEPDAMIFTQHHSREVRYAGRQGPAIVVGFDDFPHLGIWSVPGAGFVCIEPWQGHSSPVNFAGEFSDKPGLVKIAPGVEHVWTMTIRVEA